MEIVVTGRHVEVKERFRRHLEDKLTKVEQVAPRLQRLDVVVSHERNRRQSEVCDRVEITCVGKGPVVRAEACASDQYAALDQAYARLLERLRRLQDRKRVHRGRHAPESVAHATGRVANGDLVDLPSLNGSGPAHEPTDRERDHDHAGAESAEAEGSPLLIREKVHAAIPMTLDQALYEMELVGHDFFLFLDADTARPAVVYRRRGWSYGVIHLSDDLSEAEEAPEVRVAPSAAAG